MTIFSKRYTILLVNDNRVLLNATTGMVKRLGYEILRATNGKDASQIFQHNKDVINLVMLDINLPDELGSDTCLNLKEIDPGVKILHLSELGTSTDNEMLDCGCRGFLVKPFRIEELSIKLMEMLDNRSTRPRISIINENILNDTVHKSDRRSVGSANG